MPAGSMPAGIFFVHHGEHSMRKRMIFVLAFLTLPGFAQPRSGAETIEVRLIEVPVTVVDANGNPIRDLRPENFEVFDEGRRQKITTFEVVDHGRQESRTAGISAAARRNFLLLFDVTNSSPASLLRARGAASQFVTNQVLTGDRVAVATVSAHRGVRFLTAFTTDRGLVNSAIETLGAPKFFQPGDPLMLTQPETPAPPAFEVGARDAAIREFLEELSAMVQKSANDVARQNVERSIESLADLGATLDRVGGRKHVILLSEGFDPKMLHGRDSLSSPESRQEQSDTERGQIWRVDTDNLYGSTRSASDLRHMIDMLRRSDVILHAADIKGLRTNVDPREGTRPVSNEALFLLSHETGGKVFKNSNQLSDDFGRFLRSQEVTYTLGFQARRTTPGKFHKLSVKVSGLPGARVWHRVGYHEPTTAGTAIDRTLEASEIVMNTIPIDEVKFTAFAAALPERSSRQPVPLLLEIEGKGILESAIGNTAFTEIFAYAFDSEELIRGVMHQRVSFDLTKVREQLSAKGVKFYGTMRLLPGHYSIRILVRAGGHRNGFVSLPLTVPARDEQYVAGPLLFGETAGWLMVRAPLPEGTEYPFVIGERTFVPATLPVVKAGASRDLVLVLYNLPLDGLRLSAAVQGGGATADAPLTVVGRTSPDENGAIKLLLNLTPPAGVSGDGRLLLTVGGPAATEAQQVSIPLRIE
jgi:VWFA-related protein